MFPFRSLCETARSGCEPFLKSFGYEWPGYRDCRNVSLSNTGDKLCFSVLTLVQQIRRNHLLLLSKVRFEINSYDTHCLRK